MKPIVIICNYRTGSTAYSAILADQHNFINFSEPHYDPVLVEQLSTLLAESKTNFVLKIMPDQINLNPIYQQILALDCYKIKLTRNDKVEQIISQYIAKMTNKWNSPDPAVRGQVYKIPVVKSELIRAIDFIQEVDQLLDNLDINFDKEITYESINNILQDAELDGMSKKLIAPSNYEELKQQTAQLLNDR